MEFRSARFMIDRPQVPRRPRFALMPLIDVMFLLLIFFMLSSQVSPYALLPVGTFDGGERSQTVRVGDSDDLAIVVSDGFVRIGGERIVTAELRAFLERFVAEGTSGFVVIATQASSAQDVVSTLEALRAAQAEDVTLVTTSRDER